MVRTMPDIDALPITLGGNVFGWTADAAQSHDILDAFVAGGGSLVDTADSYSAWVPGHSGGESETIIGTWLRERGTREDLVIATKVSQHPDFRGLAPANIAAAADASLARLGIDAIDLHYAHFDDDVTPMPEIVAAFDELVRAGKVRHWALSNFTPARIQEALQVAARDGLTPPVALQPHYNLVHRTAYERELAPIAAEHGLAVLPYYALASGFLTGKYTREDAETRAATAARGGAVSRYFTEAGFAVVDALHEVAARHDASPTSVALAWLIAQPGAVAPIASASRVEQVPDLLAGARLDLTSEDLALLDARSAGS
jgi:aryl-alcohol dehydrogenase-like predicted oxidoreductase